MKRQFSIAIIGATLSLLSCNRNQYISEPLKIPEEVKEYPSNIDKQGEDYVFKSGHFRWNSEKEKYDYIPGEWVAQKNGYRWDPGEWQKSKLGFRYKRAKWIKAKPEPAKPRVQ